MTSEEEFEEAYAKATKIDLSNLNTAMDRLIDGVSRFKAADSIDDLDENDFAKMIADLDFAKFVTSGVMYLHGMPICGHDHSEDEEEDEDEA